MVTGLHPNGHVTCADDQNTQNTYDGLNIATSGQGCQTGQMVTG